LNDRIDVVDSGAVVRLRTRAPLLEKVMLAVKKRTNGLRVKKVSQPAIFCALILNSVFLGLAIVAAIRFTELGDVTARLYDPARYPLAYFYLTCLLAVIEAFLLFRLVRVNTIYLLAITIAAVTALTQPFMSPSDGLGHLSNIHFVAETGRMPSLFDYTGEEVLAAYERVYPKKTTLDPRVPSPYNLVLRPYEAFQPPLYYYLAGFVYRLLPVNLVQKTYGIRLLAVPVYVLAVLLLIKTFQLLGVSMRAAGESLQSEQTDLAAFAGGCVGILTSSLAVSATQISNLPPGLLLSAVTGFYVCRMLVYDDFRTRHILILGILTGLMGLTIHFSAAFFPVIACMLFRRRGIACAALYGAVVLVVLSPWFVSSLLTYGVVIPGRIAKKLFLESGTYAREPSLIWYLNGVPAQSIRGLMLPGSMMPLVAAVGICASVFVLGLSFINVKYAVKFMRDPKAVAPHARFFGFAGALVVATLLLVSVVDTFSQTGFAIRHAFVMFPFLGVVTYASLMKLSYRWAGFVAGVLVAFVVVSFVNMTFNHLVRSDIPARFIEKRVRIVSLGLKPSQDGANGFAPVGGVTQTFVADYKNLRGINLLLREPDGNVDHPHRFILKDASGNTIREADVDMSNVYDWAYHTILFDPIEQSQGKTYSFEVTPVGSGNPTRLGVALSAPHVYEAGFALVGGRRIKENVVFEPVYSYNLLRDALPQPEGEEVGVPPRLYTPYLVIPTGLEEEQNRNIGKITRNSFTQHFTCNRDNLSGVSILLCTYGRSILTRYRFQLMYPDGQVLRETVLDPSRVKDWRYYDVLFDPIPFSRGKEFMFTLFPLEDEVRTPITVQLSKPVGHFKGYVLLAGKKTSDNLVFDLLFQTKHARWVTSHGESIDKAVRGWREFRDIRSLTEGW
jgi:hypothetical protein